MSIAHIFAAGGPFMYGILLCGVVTIALIVERVRTLYFNYQTPPTGFRGEILRFIRQGNLTGAEQLAKGFAQTTPVCAIVATGCHLRAHASGEEELQSRMDEQLASEVSRIDRGTGFLAMIANVATLLGLLGTISGMISAFRAVASASAAERAMLLSHGISEALYATGFGLLVAVVGMVAYGIFQNRTDRVVTELTETTSRIYHDLLFLSESGPRDKSR